MRVLSREAYLDAADLPSMHIFRTKRLSLGFLRDISVTPIMREVFEKFFRDVTEGVIITHQSCCAT